MRIIFIILLVTHLAAFLSCSNYNRTSYAIRDFDKTLQPYLTIIVSQGILGYDTATSYVRQHVTDIELKRLIKCEHPVLRALAFREMLDRPTFNHFESIMKNLDDTAIVATDVGEWGIRYLRVSDDMLQHGKWKDTLARQKTIKEIILKHNFLSSSYYKLSSVAPGQFYYPYVKEMVLRERNLFDDFERTEDALYALASYKKPEDIHLIKELILSNISRISETSFGLMREYPNDMYLEIYEKFFPRAFYRKVCENHNTGIAASFYHSIAIYKNKRSEDILSFALNREPFMSCPIDTSYLKRELIYAIWNNPCDAYKKIRKQVVKFIKQYKKNDKKNQIELSPIEVNSTLFQKDTSKEPVTWWN